MMYSSKIYGIYVIIRVYIYIYICIHVCIWTYKNVLKKWCFLQSFQHLVNNKKENNDRRIANFCWLSCIIQNLAILRVCDLFWVGQFKTVTRTQWQFSLWSLIICGATILRLPAFFLWIGLPLDFSVKDGELGSLGGSGFHSGWHSRWSQHYGAVVKLQLSVIFGDFKYLWNFHPENVWGFSDPNWQLRIGFQMGWWKNTN